MLLMAVLFLSSACPKQEQGGTVANGSDAATPQVQQEAVPDESAVQPCTAESGESLDAAAIESVWQSLTDEDRRLLVRDGMGLERLGVEFDGKPVDGFAEMLASRAQYLRGQDWHEPGRPIDMPQYYWKFLDTFNGEYEDYATLVVGNFDGDEAQEMLHCEQYACQLLELDGSMTELPILGWDAIRSSIAWDWDGDGIDELVCTAYSPEGGARSGGNGNGLEIVGISGELLDTVNGRLPMATQYLGDMDGNGRLELLVDDLSSSRIIAMAPGGAETWSTEGIMPAIIWSLADIDGDGRAEAISQGTSGGPVTKASALRAYGFEQEQLPVPGLGDSVPQDMPVCAADLDGDGVAELLTERQIVSPATGKAVELQLPVGWAAIHYGAFPCVAIPLHLPQGNCFAVAVYQKPEGKRSDTLLIWDSTGKLIYHEYSESEIDRLYAVWDGQQDRLVMRTANAIMVLADVRDGQ